MRRNGLLLLLGCLLTGTQAAASESEELKHLLLLPATSFTTAPPTAFTAQAGVPPTAANDRISMGINYTGVQIRCLLTRRWAMELRYQTGQAPSDYGDVRARVVGVRGYRFFPREGRFDYYLGPELAYAQAKADASDYETNGTALGVFGGIHFKLSKRFAFDADLGPYVISLSEKRTRESSTHIDFVLNSALVMRIF